MSRLRHGAISRFASRNPIPPVWVFAYIGLYTLPRFRYDPPPVDPLSFMRFASCAGHRKAAKSGKESAA